jgi:hypothetical protein
MTTYTAAQQLPIGWLRQCRQQGPQLLHQGWEMHRDDPINHLAIDPNIIMHQTVPHPGN